MHVKYLQNLRGTISALWCLWLQNRKCLVLAFREAALKQMQIQINNTKFHTPGTARDHCIRAQGRTYHNVLFWKDLPQGSRSLSLVLLVYRFRYMFGPDACRICHFPWQRKTKWKQETWANTQLSQNSLIPSFATHTHHSLRHSMRGWSSMQYTITRILCTYGECLLQ